MELTRRDAVAALGALGAAGGAALAAAKAGDSRAEAPDLADETTTRASMAAVATVLYPTAVDGVDSFVDEFLDGRLDGSAHAEGLRAAVAELDEAARAWHGAPVADLSEADRDRLLREIGADVADEDPEGTTAERVRYYVVNELLLALYTSPTGGELVGIENPQGHPGGTDSYQRGPR